VGTPNAAAQAPVAPSIEQLRRPGDMPLTAPEPRPAPKPPGIAIPPPAATPSSPTLSQGGRVQARAFRFVGNTVVPDADLQAIAAPFVGLRIGIAELDDLRVRLTRRYVDAGYINSGAVIPDQDIGGGLITFEIVEGRLTEIVVGGDNRFRAGYLRDRLALGAGPVLNISQLQERMQLMLQDPQISRVAAELAPGIQRGEAALRADVTGAPAFIAGATLSNERSPAVGADQTDLFFGTRNLLGLGEAFTLRAAGTSGLRDYAASYTVPINAIGTTMHFRHQRTYSRVVEAPFNQLDIGARSTSTELGIAHPLIERPQRTLVATALLAHRSTQALFLGQPSPFVPGVPDGHTTVGAFRVGLDWVDRTPDRVFAGRAIVSHGLSAFGATVGDGFPDSRFTTLLIQAQWVQRAFGGTGQWLLRAEGQFADSPLLGSEKYSIGGIDSVRGYRKDVMVRDTGWFGSVEYRHTVGHLSLRPGAEPGEGPIRLAIFADMGQARDRAGTNPSPSYLASVGPGARWEPLPGLEVQAYRGVALKDIRTATRTSQDRGLHLRVVFARLF